MQISMHNASVPVLAKNLRNLVAVLQKAKAFAAERKIDESVLLGYRLAPDMFALARQVQIATDMSKGCVSRLAGVEIPSYGDDEKTFDDLIARLERCIAYVEGFTPAQIDGSEDKHCVVKRPKDQVEFPGLRYLLEYVHPNLHFHCTMAYAILRHCGLPLGKADYLGAL